MSWRLGNSIRLKPQIRFAALENLSDSEHTNRVWVNIKENTKTSAKESLGMYELKQHKLWFDVYSLCFLDQRKQAKMLWLQDPDQSNVDNLNNVICEASKHFRNKKKKYLKNEVD
jgi:hypothetical protein